MRERRPRTPVSRRWGVRALSASLVAIVAFEAFARWGLGLGAPPLSAAHPTIEYMFKPNQNVYRFGNHFITNAWGMRNEPFPREKIDPDELRILVFGDSVVNGGSLTDHANLATSLLEERTSEALSRPVLVANVSAGSWCPPNWLAFVTEFGFFDADYVVFVISSHDAGDCALFTPLDPNTHPTEPPFCALSEAITRYLPRYLPKMQVKSVQANEYPKSSRLAQCEHDLNLLIKRAKESVAAVGVLRYQERSEVELQEESLGGQLICRICKEQQVPTLPMLPILPKTNLDDYFRDGIHPNDVGQTYLADGLDKLLRELGLSEQASN